MSDKPVIEFDHKSPEYAADPWGFYEGLRTECPVAWTDHYAGHWVTSRYQEVFDVSRDDETFSSRKGVFDGVELTGIGLPPAPQMLLPIEVDPPELRAYRMAMNPAFSPAVVESLEPKFLDFTTWCIDRFIESGEIDLIQDLASPVPALATMLLVGLPLPEWESYAVAFHDLVAFPPQHERYANAIRLVMEIQAHMYEVVDQRRAQPGNDLVTRLVEFELDGRTFTDDEIVGILNTTLGGGIDTTTALMGQAFVYLDEHPEHRERLATDDAFMASFCEEMLRWSSPVQGFARTATRDVELAGCPIAKGERIFVSWAAANHDPAVFEDPEDVVIERFPNRHTAFGLGAHRCVGSTFARREFAIVVREVLRRMPDYRIDRDAVIRYDSIGTVNGFHRIPVHFTPGPRVGPEALPGLE